MEKTTIETEKEPSRTEGYRARLQDYVTEDPMRATLTAMALGFLLSLLPVRRVIVAVMSLMLHVARPALLVLGIVKLAELLKKRGEACGPDAAC